MIASAADMAALPLLAMQAAEAGLGDAARLARRKPLRKWHDGAMATAWEKRTLCAAELAATWAPGHDLRADRWLFRRLTRALDQAVLSLLSAPGALRDVGPFSLNLNAASITAPDFLRFDATLPPAVRGRVVLDLHLDDALADPAAFAFARGFAQSRGYRVLLRGVSAGLLPLLDLDALAPDLVQLRWSTELAALDRLPWPAERLLLARADEPAALRWGLDRGIRLFGGHAAHTAFTVPALGERAPAA